MELDTYPYQLQLIYNLSISKMTNLVGCVIEIMQLQESALLKFIDTKTILLLQLRATVIFFWALVPQSLGAKITLYV